MSRTGVIAAYRRAAELARGQGVDVRFHPGWTTRGRDGFDPRVIVEHCTSDPATLTSARMLDLLANGHGALSGNAICNDAVLRDGTVHVIASGLAWHAGESAWDGLSGMNRYGLGTEYQRAATQPLTDRQLEVGRIWTRARMAAFTIPSRRVCEHGECALPAGRKVDRVLRPGVRMSGAQWRTSLVAPPPPTPPPPPVRPPEDVMTPAQEAKLDRALTALAAIPQRVWEERTYSDPTGAPHKPPVTLLRFAYRDSVRAFEILRAQQHILDRVASGEHIDRAALAAEIAAAVSIDLTDVADKVGKAVAEVTASDVVDELAARLSRDD